MSAGDMPQMSASSYAHSTYGGVGWVDQSALSTIEEIAQAHENQKQLRSFFKAEPNINIQETSKERKMAEVNVTRMVQVLVADPNENLPLEKRLLYKSEPKLTDLTDKELYFELDVKGMLEKHNAERVTHKDKSVKDRVEMLEPARVRDLKMVVVTIATF